jgi:hypothetical protein
MDASRFDKLVRYVTAEASRRDVVKSAGVSALAVFGVTSLLGAESAEAKKKGKKKRRCKAKPAGTPCTTDKICCKKKTKRVCGIPFGGGAGDPTKCCGEAGTPCEFPSDCCAGFTCPGGGGSCQVDPV